MNQHTRNILGTSLGLLFIFAAAIQTPAHAEATTPTPMKKAVASAHKHRAPSAHVKAIQDALDKSGANLKIDGLMGKNTRAALKKFQSGHGIKATGTADKATLKALKVS